MKDWEIQGVGDIFRVKNHKSWLFNIIYLLELAMCEKFCEVCNTNTSQIKLEQEHGLWKYMKQNENNDKKLIDFVAKLGNVTFWECRNCETVNITEKKSLL